MPHPFPPTVPTMEARTSEKWPTGRLAYEPKWDGFRCLAWSEPEMRLDSRNERPLLRYFPELEPALAQLPEGTVVDGEVVVVVDGATSFDSLQQRIHPAQTRVDRLAAETPAELVAFDMLALRGEDLRALPFEERRSRLEGLASTLEAPWHLTPSTTDIELGRHWFDAYESAGCDGIIVKDLAGTYQSGKRAMTKIKHRRTVDVVVGGYREHKDGNKIGSLLLGLHTSEGELSFVGHCSGFPDADRAELFAQFSALAVDESFGVGARVPGAESRWSGGKEMDWTPVLPGVVVEVSYDQLEGNRFRHATRFHRWRPDKDPAECTMGQLELPEGPDFTDVIGARA